jgi:hypothetical protein
VKQEVDAAIEEQGLAQVKDAAQITLGSAIDGLTLKGDLRLRYELREEDGAAAATDRERDRFRTRFRLGGVWKNSSESWEVGAGLATGGAGATSTNATWDNTFETGDIRLDYAYAKHSMDNGVTLALGQQKNVFQTSYILWDSDIRPAGATVHYGQDMLFATAGAYNLFANDTADRDDMGNLYAAQTGIKADFEGTNAMLAVGYYAFDGNVYEQQGLAGYDMSLVDLYATVGTEVGDVSLGAFGQYAMNLDADSAVGSQTGIATIDPEDEDTAWVVGASAGMGKFKLGYSYAHIEADGVPFFLKDADFGSGIGFGDTNVKGHKLSAGYKVTKNFSLGATAFLYEPIEGSPLYRNDDVTLYQVDLGYKF